MPFIVDAIDSPNEAVNVIISRSGNDILASVGTVGDVPEPDQDIGYRSIEMPVERALKIAIDKANGGDVYVHIRDDVDWDPAWGELIG